MNTRPFVVALIVAFFVTAGEALIHVPAEATRVDLIKKIRICHAVSGNINDFTELTISEAAWEQSHKNHVNDYLLIGSSTHCPSATGTPNPTLTVTPTATTTPTLTSTPTSTPSPTTTQTNTVNSTTTIVVPEQAPATGRGL